MNCEHIAKVIAYTRRKGAKSVEASEANEKWWHQTCTERYDKFWIYSPYLGQVRVAVELVLDLMHHYHTFSTI